MPGALHDAGYTLCAQSKHQATVNVKQTVVTLRVLVAHQQPVQIPREMLFIFRSRACSSLSAFLRDASDNAADSSAL
jgi:hypothetical protein